MRRNAFVAFVLLLLSLAATFAFGLMIGRGQADERLVVRKEPAVINEGSVLAAKSPSSPSSRFRNMPGMEQLVGVSAVEVIGDYRLRLAFQDGTVGDVDFSGREWRGVFEPLRDPSYFARVELDPEAGTIAWPDGLDMAPEPLYAEARRHPVRTARAAN